jgi:hypothetical protein
LDVPLRGQALRKRQAHLKEKSSVPQSLPLRDQASFRPDVTLHEEAAIMWIWILRTIAIGIGKAITIDEYRKIRNENKVANEYSIFITLLQAIAKKRLITCKFDELSKDCPVAVVFDQFYQEGRTTPGTAPYGIFDRTTLSGTAPLRIFTIVGLDGQIINLQCFDLSQKVKVTVQHTNGKIDFEEIDPSEALKRIEMEAGYRPH